MVRDNMLNCPYSILRLMIILVYKLESIFSSPCVEKEIGDIEEYILVSRFGILDKPSTSEEDPILLFHCNTWRRWVKLYLRALDSATWFVVYENSIVAKLICLWSTPFCINEHLSFNGADSLALSSGEMLGLLYIPDWSFARYQISPAMAYIGQLLSGLNFLSWKESLIAYVYGSIEESISKNEVSNLLRYSFNLVCLFVFQWCCT